MKKIFIFPYKMGSNGAKLLSKGLNAKRVFPDGNYIPKKNHSIINWGNSHEPKWGKNQLILNGSVKVLNHWSKIQVSGNKLSSLKTLQEHKVAVPEFTTDINEAKKWIQNKETVVCRKILTGHSGAGIVIAQKEDQLVPAPLYTKYFKRKAEYRLVIFNGEIIDFCQKKKKTDFDGEVNTFIRCNHNGYVYAYENVNVPQIVKDEAIKAIKALKLDFGSVDAAFNEAKNLAVIFECNSSAGFSSENSPAFKKYLAAFKKLID